MSDRISSFGRYHGYSKPTYDSVARSSQYVAMRDGVKVAVDVFRPAVGGVVETRRLPVALTVTRYWRARITDTGMLLGSFGPMPESSSSMPLQIDPVGFNEPARPQLVHHLLAAHGYVFVCFENRGTGASFGKMGEHGDADDAGPSRGMLTGIKEDLFDMVAWCAAQPWSNGRVAMTGGSWLGSMQLLAAATHPPALEAITPNVPSAFHGHRITHFGGVFFKGAMVTMGRTMIELAKNDGVIEFMGVRIVGPAPVDEDPSGELLRAARAGHGEASFAAYFSTTLETVAAQEMFAGLGITEYGEKLETFFSVDKLGTLLRDHPEFRESLNAIQFYDSPEGAEWAKKMHEDISSSGIPSYWFDGWRDAHPHDRLVMFRNHRGPKRLCMGPWGHGPKDPLDQRDKESCNILAIESLRWFDRYVKDIDNGIETEEPIAYAQVFQGPMWRWRHARDWPSTDVTPQEWYFAADGGLCSEKTSTAAEDRFTVDYSATSGESNVYASVAGGPAAAYGDMCDNDAKGLSYTTNPLPAPVLVTGSPVVKFFATADQADATFVVHVEEVLPGGRAELVKQGFLRTSHRTLRELPYDNMDVPFWSSLAEDVDATPPLDEGAVEIVIATEPMAHTFQAGSRIRIAITGADEGVIWMVPQDPPPTIAILRGPEHPSHVVLPVAGIA